MHHTAQGSIFHQVYNEEHRLSGTGVCLLSGTGSGTVSEVCLQTNHSLIGYVKELSILIKSQEHQISFCGTCKHLTFSFGRYKSSYS